MAQIADAVEQIKEEGEAALLVGEMLRVAVQAERVDAATACNVMTSALPDFQSKRVKEAVAALEALGVKFT